MPSLIVRDSKNGRVKEIPLRKRRFTIGKSDWNDLVLPRETIAREHCVIFFREDAFLVRDLSGDRPGTMLDGKKVEGDAPIADGARIEVGDFEILFKTQRERTKGGQASNEDPEAAGSAKGSAGGAEDSADDADPQTKARKMCHQRLLEAKELKRIDFEKISEAEARERTERVVVAIIKEIEAENVLPTGIDKHLLLKEVLDEALGLGPLEDLLADDDVNEIMVNAWDKVYIERKGHGMILSDKRFTSNDQVIHVIRRIIAPVGRRINEQTPIVDARLKDGSRVNAIIPPLAVSGPSLTIRKFPKHRLFVDDLIKFGSLSRGMGKFLELAVRERMNVVISGGTGSGKTTLLNVVGSFIPKHERVVTVEDVSELKLPQDHVVTLESRPPNLEGQGAISIRDLVKNCLRMRPDRIVVGECRSGEALDMLQAMNTGHDGSMTTIHSNSPRDCISRIETLVLMAGMDLPSRAIREQIAAAVNVIVQQTRLSDGSRKVTAISEITGMEGGIVTLNDIYKFNQTGFTPEGKVIGKHEATGQIPVFVGKLRKRGIKIDMSMFENEKPEKAEREEKKA
jgi:pilus assembly protein CpaF